MSKLNCKVAGTYEIVYINWVDHAICLKETNTGDIRYYSKNMPYKKDMQPPDCFTDILDKAVHFHQQ